MLTMESVLNRVLSSMNTSKAKTQEFPLAASPGQWVRQGDVIIMLLDKIPEKAIREKNPTVQVAPGTTRGSRHCLDCLKGVSVFKLVNPTALDGPILSLTEQRTLEHPDHGHWILHGGCSYAIKYERVRAEELKRMKD